MVVKNDLEVKHTTFHRRLRIEGIDIHYREAGSEDAPSIILLHGFPTSSHMFRHLIPELSDKYHVVAPDYPGFGYSSMPNADQFEYTFDNLALMISRLIRKLGLKNYTLYIQDYGGPVGFRIAVNNPKMVKGLIIQNGNAYGEGLSDFWDPLRAYWDKRTTDNAEPLESFLTLDATIWQFTHGVRNIEAVSPDNWSHVQPLLDRPGNRDIQLDLFYSYGSNPALYPTWQDYLRKYQPPALIVWGKNDQIFSVDGAYQYKRDLRNLDFHLLDTGHFALEEDLHTIAGHIRYFMANI